MKSKRKKQNRKALRFYQVGFRVEEPYRVLVEPSFITEALSKRIHLRDDLVKICQGRVTPVVSSCIMDELRTRKTEEASMAAAAVKHLYRLKCVHYAESGLNPESGLDCKEEEDIESSNEGGSEDSMQSDSQLLNPDTASDANSSTNITNMPSSGSTRKRNQHPLASPKCIIDLIGRRNPRRLIVATQNPALKRELRKIPGVPIMSFVGPHPMIEPPSQASRALHQQLEQEKLKPANWERTVLPCLQTDSAPHMKQRKKHGKNPLSCKKPLHRRFDESPAKRRRVRSKRQSSHGKLENATGTLAGESVEHNAQVTDKIMSV